MRPHKFRRLFALLPFIALLISIFPVQAQVQQITVNPTLSANNGGGEKNWDDTANVFSSDGNRASISLKGQTSNYLDVTGFSLSIPNDAVIKGVTVKIERGVNQDRAIDTRDNAVKLIVGGSKVGNNYANTTLDWSDSETIVTYGGATDTWGLSLTATDLNSSNFGVAVQATRASGDNQGQNARIDHVQVIVHYEEAEVEEEPQNTLPAITFNGNQTIAEGSSASFTASFSDPDAHDSTWSVSMNYGDGTVLDLGQFSSANNMSITIPDHIYTNSDNSPYTATLTVCDSVCTTANATVTIQDNVIVVTPTPPPPAPNPEPTINPAPSNNNVVSTNNNQNAGNNSDPIPSTSSTDSEDFGNVLSDRTQTESETSDHVLGADNSDDSNLLSEEEDKDNNGINLMCFLPMVSLIILFLILLFLRRKGRKFQSQSATIKQ